MLSSELLHDYPRVLKTASSEQPVKSGDTLQSGSNEAIAFFSDVAVVP